MAIVASDSLPSSSGPPTATAWCTSEPPFFSVGASTTSGQQNVVRILYHSGGHRPVRLPISPLAPQFAGTGNPLVAQFVVDNSDTMETKMESIRCYATQSPPAKAMTLEGIRAINTAEGLAAGCLAAEVFWSPRPIRTQDLMQTLFGERAKGLARPVLACPSETGSHV